MTLHEATNIEKQRYGEIGKANLEDVYRWQKWEKGVQTDIFGVGMGLQVKSLEFYHERTKETQASSISELKSIKVQTTFSSTFVKTLQNASL